MNMEKKNLTVADILNVSANDNRLCYMYDEAHQVDESVTEAEISNGDCTYDWATATVTYWHVTDEGNLEFSAELQNFDTTRVKYLEIAEDLSMIRDAAQQEIRDIKSFDGPLTEDDRNKIANIRKAKVRLEYFITATNMAANKKAVITPLGWLNMLAVCEFVRDIDIMMLNVLLRDVMDIYAPAFNDIKFADCMQPPCAEVSSDNKRVFDLCGFVCKHTNAMYELWGVELADDDAAIIRSILAKYQNEGMTVCGDPSIKLEEVFGKKEDK